MKNRNKPFLTTTKNKRQMFAVLITVGIFVATIFLLKILAQNIKDQNDHHRPLIVTNLTYCNGEKLDIRVPAGDGLKPLVIYVHGGGWRYGSKVGGAAPYFYQLNQMGYAVASINYRLSDRVEFPLPVEDVQCAVRFLKEHASVLGLDVARFALAGQSSGGNLALTAALGHSEALFNDSTQPYANQTNSVRAVIALGAHYDLTADDFSAKSQENIASYLGDLGNRKLASPVDYLDPSDPAILIFHGTNDKTINIRQAQNFIQKANTAGIKTEFVPVDHADHNLRSWLGRDYPRPSARLQMIDEFLTKYTVSR